MLSKKRIKSEFCLKIEIKRRDPKWHTLVFLCFHPNIVNRKSINVVLSTTTLSSSKRMILQEPTRHWALLTKESSPSSGPINMGI